jgi:hypothetical protein
MVERSHRSDFGEVIDLARMQLISRTVGAIAHRARHLQHEGLYEDAANIGVGTESMPRSGQRLDHEAGGRCQGEPGKALRQFCLGQPQGQASSNHQCQHGPT